MVKWPLQRLSDLRHGDQMVTNWITWLSFFQKVAHATRHHGGGTLAATNGFLRPNIWSWNGSGGKGGKQPFFKQGLLRFSDGPETRKRGNMFFVKSLPGEMIQIWLAHIFQMGWNHQLASFQLLQAVTIWFPNWKSPTSVQKRSLMGPPATNR